MTKQRTAPKQPEATLEQAEDYLQILRMSEAARTVPDHQAEVSSSDLSAMVREQEALVERLRASAAAA